MVERLVNRICISVRHGNLEIYNRGGMGDRVSLVFVHVDRASTTKGSSGDVNVTINNVTGVTA